MSLPLLVLKVGGRVDPGAGALSALPALLGLGGEPPACRVCIVHGGGPEVTRWMERLDLPVRFKDGLRVTDPPALEVATMVLRGAVSTALVAALAANGIRAAGLSGVDGGMVRARPHTDPELGLVGEVDAIQPEILEALLARGIVPLVAPLALDSAGTVRNVNGDTLCGALAGALGATLAVFLTDVPGVLDAQGTPIEQPGCRGGGGVDRRWADPGWDDPEGARRLGRAGRRCRRGVHRGRQRDQRCCPRCWPAPPGPGRSSWPRRARTSGPQIDVGWARRERRPGGTCSHGGILPLQWTRHGADRG